MDLVMSPLGRASPDRILSYRNTPLPARLVSSGLATTGSEILERLEEAVIRQNFHT
jgi:hypothetical protein